MYLLDTDTLTNFLDESRNYPQLRRRILQVDYALIFTSVVSAEELLRRVLPRIQNDRNTARIVERYAALVRLLTQFNSFQMLNFDTQALQVFTSLPNAVRQHHPNDCRIAAIALSRGYVVITANTRHFGKIPGVACEDWTLDETAQ